VSRGRDVLVTDRFTATATALRAHFDERFAEPRAARADRFVWDYWHVPGQYTHLRTPAYNFFPKRLYERFHRELVLFGRRVLGCHDVSPPWLSCYIEGCGQELHADLPHGPLAFVFSLTRWRGRRFTGGETMLLRSEALDWWRGFESLRGVEEQELVRAVAPEQNRLVVFDPRIPHGVRRVAGTHDPREGRLVIHGWFVQPRPFVEGALSAKQVESALVALHEAVGALLADGLSPTGLVSLRLAVDATGVVREVRVLSDTTRTAGEDEPRRRAFVRALLNAAGRLRFIRRRGGSLVTLPLLFTR
jgi:hypothetical protein